MKQTELARHLCLSTVRIRALAKDGVLIKSGRGDWPADENRERYIRYLQKRSRGRPASGTGTGSGQDSELLEIKLNRERLNQRRQELEVSKLEGNHVEIAPVLELFEHIAAEVRQGMRAAASTLAPQLVGLDDENEIAAFIEDELDNGLRSLASANERILSSFDTTAAANR